jgi:formate hydrogenlyase subunit 3/multisubunit Na+/H+ antiporter MnhD subunit
MLSLLFAGLIFLVAGGLFLPVLPRSLRRPFLALFLAIGSFLSAIPAVAVLGGANPVTWVWSGRIIFSLDSLSAFFVLLISGASLLTGLFASGSLKGYESAGRSVGMHGLFLCWFTAAMTAVVVSRHGLAFLFFWEIMSVTSFFLITFEHEKKEVFAAGLQYLVTMQAGAFLLFGAFLILSIRTGSWDLQAIAGWAASGGHGQISWIAFSVLLFAGFGLKAGFVPLHSWLGHAHPAAPGHVSALLSGVMIKTGIYGILRFLALAGQPEFAVSLGVILVSGFTAVWAVLHGLGQKDLKRFLAMCSVENIGIIGLGVGFGMLGRATGNSAMCLFGFSGALLHTFNHAAAKSLLFLGAASVYDAVHGRDIEKLGGLGKIIPLTSAPVLVGSASLSGIPPLNGFAGELLIFLAMARGISVTHPLQSIISILAITLLGLCSALALAGFVKTYGTVFLGRPRSDLVPKVRKREKFRMIFPLMILSLLCIVTGFFPSQAIAILSPIIPGLSGEPVRMEDFGFLTTLSVAFGIFAGFAGLLLGFRALLVLVNGSRKTPVWACGARPEGGRLQHTGSSFIRPLNELFKNASGWSVHTEGLEGLFRNRPPTVTSSVTDKFEERIQIPFWSRVRSSLRWFGWIQNGRSRDYILFGIIFLILVIVIVLGGKP